MSTTFKIGVAREIVSPPLGTPLYGYAFQRTAKSVNDDLNVSAIAINQGNITAMMLSADIVSIGKELGDRIRMLISEETKIPTKNITFSATHTHSGPAIKTANGWGNANVEYIEEILIPQSIKAAKSALEAVEPALMGVGTTRSEVGVNRRELNIDGEILLGQNPYGVFDPEMTVISFQSPSGKPIANIIHYGAHGTASGRNTEITRDWMGVMVDGVERETNAITVFFNGAEGDVGPRLSNGQTTGDVGDWTLTDIPTGNIAYAKELGALATIDAIRAYKSIKEYKEVSFKLQCGTLQLPYDAPPTLEAAKERLEELGDPSKLIEVENREYAKLCGIIELYEKNLPIKTHFTFEQTIFAFNSTVFVPFPFELFSEIALRMRTYSPFDHTLCLCNTNDSNFYLPSYDQMERGGYEIEIFRRGNVYKLNDRMDDIIIKENMKLLNTVFKQEDYI